MPRQVAQKGQMTFVISFLGQGNCHEMGNSMRDHYFVVGDSAGK